MEYSNMDENIIEFIDKNIRILICPFLSFYDRLNTFKHQFD